MNEQLMALAKRIELYASLGVEGCDRWRDDLRTVVTMLNEAAEARPVAWMHRLHFPDGMSDAILSFGEDVPDDFGERKLAAVSYPLFTHPAPQPQPTVIRQSLYGDEERLFTQPERQPVNEPTEAWQLLADLVAGLEATHWSSWQTTAHFDSALDAARAALAAKE